MDFKDAIKQLGESVEKLKESLLPGDPRKNTLVLPFLSVAEYDVFNQLLRYFYVFNVKFGMPIPGILYRFYTDPEIPGKMDEKPFPEINLSDLHLTQTEELKKFNKACFDIYNILSSAQKLKYSRKLKIVLNAEFANPGPEFVPP